MKNKKSYAIIFGIMSMALILAGCASIDSSRGKETGATGTGIIIEPEDQDKLGLYNYSDSPLESVPFTPISVKYLVEHRSALNEKAVTVHGVVVDTLLGEKACPNDINGIGVGMCAQPRIFLADTSKEDRDKNYDVMVLVSEEEKGYKIGDVVDVKATVTADKTSVSLMKVY